MHPDGLPCFESSCWPVHDTFMSAAAGVAGAVGAECISERGGASSPGQAGPLQSHLAFGPLLTQPALGHT